MWQPERTATHKGGGARPRHTFTYKGTCMGEARAQINTSHTHATRQQHLELGPWSAKTRRYQRQRYMP